MPDFNITKIEATCICGHKSTTAAAMLRHINKCKKWDKVPEMTKKEIAGLLKVKRRDIKRRTLAD